jgi:hypothetical protein
MCILSPTITMSRGNRAIAPPGYHHLNDLCLFSERTAAPPPLQELPDVLSLGHVEKEWQGMLEPSKLRLMRNDNGDRVVTKEYDGILPEVVDHIKSMHCNHPDWCIVGVRACIVTDSCVPARLAGAAKPAKVIIVQDYMELHSFKDILPPPQLPQSPPPVSEAACAWVAKCVRAPSTFPHPLRSPLLHYFGIPNTPFPTDFARTALHRQL